VIRNITNNIQTLVQHPAQGEKLSTYHEKRRFPYHTETAFLSTSHQAKVTLIYYQPSKYPYMSQRQLIGYYY
ncbi:hypothetical protein, partial [Enterocloster bolteae]|uniref:hypothetical protein n=1 Tax=Enterocloster bolteae TaxID=208479 RepID=UPI001EDDDF34